jgi:drug/metabolite transporter (DMT)-like permease
VSDTQAGIPAPAQTPAQTPAPAQAPPEADSARPRLSSAALAVAAMVFVGSSVAVSGTLTTAPLFLAQAVRYALAAVILLFLVRRLRIPVRKPRGAEWLWLAGVAATGLVLFNVAIVRGVAHAQPAMIAVAVACVPVLLGVLGPVLQGRRPEGRILVAAVVVTAGAVLVEGAGHANAAGIAWAAVALACEAGFTLLAVPVLGRLGAWGVSFHTVWMGAALFAVLALAAEGPSAVTRLTAPDVLSVAYLAVFVTVAAFVLWYSAVAALGPGRAGLITGIAPVSAALAGIALGSRSPDPLMWAGIAVVAAGLVLGLRPAPGDAPGRRPPGTGQGRGYRQVRRPGNRNSGG